MSRPITERKIHFTSPSRIFAPRGVPVRDQDTVSLSRDEAEAIRLADLEGLYQQAAALRMGISRPTFGRIIECAHRKIADALINGKRLHIEGGEILPQAEEAPRLRIALPTRADQVDEHFGHCGFFTVYSFGKDGKLESEERIEAPDGCACKSGLPARLGQMGVTHLVACHVGQGAAGVLRSYGITVVRGACGSIKEAAETFIRDYLSGRAKPEDRAHADQAETSGR